MFLEINNLKKSFGTGESRVEVLKGIQFSVEKAYNVKYFTPDSFIARVILTTFSAPFLCPKVLGIPLFFAQRPFPSIIIAICVKLLSSLVKT